MDRQSYPRLRPHVLLGEAKMRTTGVSEAGCGLGLGAHLWARGRLKEAALQSKHQELVGGYFEEEAYG